MSKVESVVEFQDSEITFFNFSKKTKEIEFLGEGSLCGKRYE